MIDGTMAFSASEAAEAYLSTYGEAARARSDAYDEGEQIWGLAAVGYSLLVTFILYQTGFIRTLRDKLEGWTPRWIALFPFILVFTIVSALLTFPMDVWLGHFREQAFGLSNQRFGEWFSEYGVNFAVNAGVATIGIGLLYYIIRGLKRTWWIWGAGATAVFLAALIAAGPVFIAPLTNTYEPMEEGPLKADILAMADAVGVPANDVYVYDRSRQTNTISANVSGLLGTTRISLADTLLNDATPEETRAVMAHEIGHYVLNHIWEMIIYFVLIIAVGFAFVNASFTLVLQAIGRRWGVRDIGDIAGMPLLFALLGVYFTLATPVLNSIIRSNETEADIFGLALAREPDGFAAVAMKLGAYRKIDPGKWERIIFHDHPSARDRVEMAMRFKASELAAGATDLDPATAPLADEVRRYLAARETARAEGG